MILHELTQYLESFAPLAYQESYDNSGLLVGNPQQEVRGILISLDCTEAVVEEAIRTGCNVIVSHHPVVFKGLKKLTGANEVERVVMQAIRHDIALYAIHTNLDHVQQGVNAKIAERLGLQNTKILAPKSGLLRKLVVFVPQSHTMAVRDALFEVGAGHIGQYKGCSFRSVGEGTFQAQSGANPYVGQVGELHTEAEDRLEVIYTLPLERKLIARLLTVHPYEEVAYDCLDLQNAHQGVGAGMIGQLPSPMSETEALAWIKTQLKATVIRHTALLGKEVKTIAVCGGAGGFLLGDAQSAGADFFVTADYKYHEFFNAAGQIVIADVGHFESEQFTQELLLELIQKKFPNFAVRLTEIDTNPIKYYS
jgi:dinuclear metal center YbgI/SA1388 family protein